MGVLRQAGLFVPTALGEGAFSTVLVLKLSLDCLLRMLLAAGDRNPQDRKSCKMILQGSSPL